MGMKKKGVYLAGAVLAATMMVGGAAQAQERGVPIYEKPRPDYDALGVRMGGFMLKPKVTAGMTYNDNIYAEENDEESDMIYTVAPEIDARSDWSRHALGVNAGVKAGLYGSESDENYVDGHIFADGRVDVLAESFLTGQVGFQRLHEERGDPDVGGVDNWDEPSTYSRSSADLSYFHGLGKISTLVGAGFAQLDYSDVDLVGGGQEDLGHRDRDLHNINARVAYDMHPDVKPFITTRYVWRDYDLSTADRDSKGYRIGVGTGFDLGGITSGEVYAGYMKQDYDNDNYEDISGAWYGLDLLWNATEMTSVEVYARKVIKETTSADASGIDASEAGIRADHELLRNLLIGAYLDYIHDDYEGRDLTNKYYTYGPRLTYLWNRNLRAELGYTRKEKDSNINNREYTENRVMLTVSAAF